jgi:hypothetical protein
MFREDESMQNGTVENTRKEVNETSKLYTGLLACLAKQECARISDSAQNKMVQNKNADAKQSHHPPDNTRTSPVASLSAPPSNNRRTQLA